MAQSSQQKVTQDLLARAHSPDSANRIFSEKIQHRPLHLRPSSPPPATVNARTARRKLREAKKNQKKTKPKPLSSRERRKLGLYDIPKEGHKYEIYEQLNKLWQGYMREVLGNEVFTGGPAAAGKLASAEYHGAEVEVVRSRCPGRVGLQGIVLRDRKFVFEVITKKRGVKMIPKEGTTFRIQVHPETDEEADETIKNETKEPFVFDVLGDQMMLRPADRANRKFKEHFLKKL